MYETRSVSFRRIGNHLTHVVVLVASTASLQHVLSEIYRVAPTDETHSLRATYNLTARYVFCTCDIAGYPS